MSISFQGADLELVHHPYWSTHLTERAVELAVAFRWRDGREGDGLEIGNVLGHYGVTGHRVVDRYEVADGVENIDVFDVDGAYDWIIAVSTLEHVRWDEEDRQLGGSYAALEHLLLLLRPGGSILVTIPTGHHPDWDRLIRRGETGASRSWTYSRTEGQRDRWVLDDEPRVQPYGGRTDWANTVFIGEWTNE